jgi:hypothetical protein
MINETKISYDYGSKGKKPDAAKSNDVYIIDKKEF